jgi:hypothetical protein
MKEGGRKTDLKNYFGLDNLHSRCNPQFLRSANFGKITPGNFADVLPETNHHDTLLGIHGYKWYSMKGLLLCGE